MTELREGQEVDIFLEPKTDSGNDADYQVGSSVWKSSDNSIATVNVDPANELHAKVKGVNGSNNGAVVVTCELDGDPDAGVNDIIGSGSFVVHRGKTTVVEFQTGEPHDPEPFPVPEPAPTPEPVSTEPTAPATDVPAEQQAPTSDVPATPATDVPADQAFPSPDAPAAPATDVPTDTVPTDTLPTQDGAPATNVPTDPGP